MAPPGTSVTGHAPPSHAQSFRAASPHFGMPSPKTWYPVARRHLDALPVESCFEIFFHFLADAAAEGSAKVSTVETVIFRGSAAPLWFTPRHGSIVSRHSNQVTPENIMSSFLLSFKVTPIHHPDLGSSTSSAVNTFPFVAMLWRERPISAKEKVVVQEFLDIDGLRAFLHSPAYPETKAVLQRIATPRLNTKDPFTHYFTYRCIWSPTEFTVEKWRNAVAFGDARRSLVQKGSVFPAVPLEESEVRFADLDDGQPHGPLDINVSSAVVDDFEINHSLAVIARALGDFVGVYLTDYVDDLGLESDGSPKSRPALASPTTSDAPEPTPQRGKSSLIAEVATVVATARTERYLQPEQFHLLFNMCEDGTVCITACTLLHLPVLARAAQLVGFNPGVGSRPRLVSFELLPELRMRREISLLAASSDDKIGFPPPLASAGGSTSTTPRHWVSSVDDRIPQTDKKPFSFHRVQPVIPEPPPSLQRVGNPTAVMEERPFMELREVDKIRIEERETISRASRIAKENPQYSRSILRRFDNVFICPNCGVQLSGRESACPTTYGALAKYVAVERRKLHERLWSIATERVLESRVGSHSAQRKSSTSTDGRGSNGNGAGEGNEGADGGAMASPITETPVHFTADAELGEQSGGGADADPDRFVSSAMEENSLVPPVLYRLSKSVNEILQSKAWRNRIVYLCLPCYTNYCNDTEPVQIEKKTSQARSTPNQYFTSDAGSTLSARWSSGLRGEDNDAALLDKATSLVFTDLQQKHRKWYRGMLKLQRTQEAFNEPENYLQWEKANRRHIWKRSLGFFTPAPPPPAKPNTGKQPWHSLHVRTASPRPLTPRVPSPTKHSRRSIHSKAQSARGPSPAVQYIPYSSRIDATHHPCIFESDEVMTWRPPYRKSFARSNSRTASRIGSRAVPLQGDPFQGDLFGAEGRPSSPVGDLPLDNF